MSVLRGNACRRRLASALAWALIAVLIHPPEQAAGQSSQQPQATPSEQKLEQAEESQPHLTPAEIRQYDKAKTLIDWTPKQIRALPELRELQPAESQQDLPAILRKVGERVVAFFEDIPNTTSTEEVQSGLCGIDIRAKCAVTFEDKFNYLLVARRTEGEQFMTEYRTDAKGRPIDYRLAGRGRILTYGFATAPLQHFHPRNQMACRFRYFGRQMVDGQETDVVGFAEIPGKYRRPGEFRHGDMAVALLVQGLAWIDATTYQILRIQTYLLAPRPDVGLEREITRIEFSAIQLHEISTAFWLPTKAVVDVWLDHRHLRNIHTYSNLKLFRVESRIRPAVEK
jgi:hypothetical protein